MAAILVSFRTVLWKTAQNSPVNVSPEYQWSNLSCTDPQPRLVIQFNLRTNFVWLWCLLLRMLCPICTVFLFETAFHFCFVFIFRNAGHRTQCPEHAKHVLSHWSTLQGPAVGVLWEDSVLFCRSWGSQTPSLTASSKVWHKRPLVFWSWFWIWCLDRWNKVTGRVQKSEWHHVHLYHGGVSRLAWCPHHGGHLCSTVQNWQSCSMPSSHSVRTELGHPRLPDPYLVLISQTWLYRRPLGSSLFSRTLSLVSQLGLGLVPCRQAHCSGFCFLALRKL